MLRAVRKAGGILVVGNPTIDEFVGASKPRTASGGAVLYAACAAACLGSSVRILGNIGPDYPPRTLSWLRSRRVDPSRVLKTSEPTTRFLIEYRREKRKLRVLAPGSKISHVASEQINIVHLGPVFGEVSLHLVHSFRRRCNFLSTDLQGFVRTSDRKGLVSNVRRELGVLLQSCDLVKASVSEVETQFDASDAQDGLDAILRRGPHFAAVTLGRKGCIVGSSDGKKFLVPAFQDPKTIDPTGAGDVLVGAWLSVFAATRDVVWATSVGSALASLTSRKKGLTKFAFSRNELFRRSSWVYQRVERL